MGTQSNNEKVLSLINEMQHSLDEIFFYIDDQSVNELKLGLALVNLEKAKNSINLAKSDITQERSE